MTSQTRVATTVTTLAFLRMLMLAGALAWVPGTTSPRSPCVSIRMGNTMNSTMNQITA